MENFAHRRVIEELLRGREIANKLRYVLNNEGGDIGDENYDDRSTTTTTPFAEELVKEVLMSFTNSLLVLNNPTSESLHDTSKSEDSQESNCKSSIILNKERRGCYKRRKNSQTWVKESEFPEEDGHQWRKYGQKTILHAKYPRNYYRCTHKYDQGCSATKQVQRIQEDPPLHKTTYSGHHTCRNLQNPDIIVDSVLSPSDQSSMFLSFDNTFPTLAKHDCPFLSSSSSSVKREVCKEEETTTPPPPSSSPNDHYHMISSELNFDDSQKHVTLSSTPDSNHIGAFPDNDLYYSELDDICFGSL